VELFHRRRHLRRDGGLLSQMPDVKVATPSTEGARVDAV